VQVNRIPLGWIGVAHLPDNLASLHAHEEEIRQKSLAAIQADSDLWCHLSIVHSGMCVVFALAHDHVHLNEDELTTQFLGLRLFNSAASTMKLALSGYYQTALALVRDLFETTALLDYLQRFPNQIAVWRASDHKQRMNKFSPAKIRKALDEDDGFEGRKREQFYRRLSEYATHPTPPGFTLLAPEGLGKIGPFFSDKYLRAWIEETAKLLALSGLIFASHFSPKEPAVLLVELGFLRDVREWQKRYLADAESSDGPT